MKLYCIANVRIPTENAHGIQIMKMCEAFSRIEPYTFGTKIEVELIVPKRFNPIKTDQRDSLC